jgi:hypothetical protein
MKRIECQGMTFVTTDDVAHAIANFSAAARRRGRVVRIDVPVVDPETPVIGLVLSPGEVVEISDSPMPSVELDTAPLIRSLTVRQLAWLPRTGGSDTAGDGASTRSDAVPHPPSTDSTFSTATDKA